MVIREIEKRDKDGNVDKKEDCTILWPPSPPIQQATMEPKLYFMIWKLFISTLLYADLRNLFSPVELILMKSLRNDVMIKWGHMMINWGHKS